MIFQTSLIMFHVNLPGCITETSIVKPPCRAAKKPEKMLRLAKLPIETLERLVVVRYEPGSR